MPAWFPTPEDIQETGSANERRLYGMLCSLLGDHAAGVCWTEADQAKYLAGMFQSVLIRHASFGVVAVASSRERDGRQHQGPEVFPLPPLPMGS